MSQPITQADADQAEAYLAVDRFFRAAKLHAPLAGGLRIEFNDLSDWTVAGEIFFAGQYDLPIGHLIGETTGPVRVLDLGAHTGLFSLRLVDQWRRAGRPARDLEIVAVEPHPATAARARERLQAAADRTGAHLHVVEGAVGAPGTSIRLGDTPLANFNATGGTGHLGGALFGLHSRPPIEVPCLDVEALSPPGQPLHLLKIDIEGGEQALLQHHPALLARAERVVLEIHPWALAKDDARRALARAGFSRTYRLHGGEAEHDLLVLFALREPGPI